jgi:hypothetical protein
MAYLSLGEVKTDWKENETERKEKKKEEIQRE